MFKKKKIPVHIPEIINQDISSVYNAIKSTQISGQSKIVENFEKNFAKWQGSKYAVSVSNGTTALFLAVKVLNLKKNDEVILSSNTNIATALAVYHNNLKVVPVDSDIETWNLNVNLIEKLITKKTKLIIPVHFLGNPVDMNKLIKISKKYNLKIIEDCAEAHGATINNKKIGTFGDLNCYSFYSNKIITTGEGGMIVTNNKKYYKELQLLKNLYFSKPRFYHKKPAYNFRLGAMQAALGISQLKRIDKILVKKIRLFKLYKKFLKDIEGIKLQKIYKNTKAVFWMIGILVNPQIFGSSKKKLESRLNSNGIDTRNFFYPMNMQPFLKNKKFKKKCKTSMLLWKNAFYLPSSNNLTEKEVKFICNIISNKTKK